MHTISQLETSAVTTDSEKKRMEAKIEQGYRVIT
jgi:carbonic anhydrase